MQDIDDRHRAEDEVRPLNSELEERVLQRTMELTEANQELESFAYSISHDLRAPLRGIDGFSRLLQEEYEQRLDTQGREYLARVRRAAQRMGTLIDDLLELSRMTRQEMKRQRVDLSSICREVVANLRQEQPGRTVEVSIQPGCTGEGDPQLLRVLLENLLGNAWKYTRTTSGARIEFGVEHEAEGDIFYIRDNGVGFDMVYASKLFSPFQRLHNPNEFEGSGIGLASVWRVVRRHGGQIKATAEIGQGATFCFSLAAAPSNRPQ
jgi:light-regulated signal transduction histidine kinase (bacteriophytochrome)